MPAPEILDVPPAEAVEHFRARGFHTGFDWRDTDAEQHLVSFTAAKAAKLDILQDLRTAADKAIADGTTFETFAKELQPTLVRKGWWGRQPMTDPLTGKTRIVQLGSAHRLRIIFDTNIRMAYARGRWERIERLREAMPWLRYVAVQDARTRPDHLAWHGTILPVDHPFWKTHYPPNGWKCRCIVQQLGDDDLERYGYKVSSGPPPLSGRTRPWKNRRTGRIHQVPLGIDPGFQHNVGRARPGRDSANRLIEKIDDAPPDLARAAIGKPWRGQLFRSPPRRPVRRRLARGRALRPGARRHRRTLPNRPPLHRNRRKAGQETPRSRTRRLRPRPAHPRSRGDVRGGQRPFRAGLPRRGRAPVEGRRQVGRRWRRGLHREPAQGAAP